MNIRLLAMTILPIAMCAVLVGCGGEEPKTDAEFLQEVRETPQNPQAASNESGAIDPSGEGAPPQIAVDTEEFDMGLVAADDFTFRDMPIYNKGEQPLVISNITTQCPCTTGEMVDDTIPPGGTGTMRIRLDPNIVQGYTSRKVLTIHSNDPVHPNIRVAVNAKLEGALEFSDNAIAFPEPIQQGQSGQHSIRITQTTKEPITITDTTLRGAPQGMSLDVKLVPGNERANADFPEWEVIVAIGPETPSGNYEPIAEIRYDEGRTLKKSFAVRATVEGIYNFAPQEITLRNIEPGNTYNAVTTLTSKVPLTIEKIETGNAVFDVTHSPGEEPNTFVFDIATSERPDNRLQKDEWTVSMTVDGEQVTETVKLVALFSRQ